MSQNMISLTLTDAQLQAADAALTSLEAAFTGLIALQGDHLGVERNIPGVAGDRGLQFRRSGVLPDQGRRVRRIGGDGLPELLRGG